MTIDEAILKALEEGPVTVEDMLKQFERRIRIRLQKLCVRGLVLRQGRGGPHRMYTYTLLDRDRAAKALKAKGGLATTAKNVRTRLEGTRQTPR
jgi:predicted transcriptional regulator